MLDRPDSGSDGVVEPLSPGYRAMDFLLSVEPELAEAVYWATADLRLSTGEARQARRRTAGRIPGTRNPEHLEANVAAADIELNRGTLARIETLLPADLASGDALLS